jgi:hypothetical protein
MQKKDPQHRRDNKCKCVNPVLLTKGVQCALRMRGAEPRTAARPASALREECLTCIPLRLIMTDTPPLAE